ETVAQEWFLLRAARAGPAGPTFRIGHSGNLAPWGSLPSTAATVPLPGHGSRKAGAGRVRADRAVCLGSSTPADADTPGRSGTRGPVAPAGRRHAARARRSAFSGDPEAGARPDGAVGAVLASGG